MKRKLPKWAIVEITRALKAARNMKDPTQCTCFDAASCELEDKVILYVDTYVAGPLVRLLEKAKS